MGFTILHTYNTLRTHPCNENRVFPVWKYYTGTTLFWSCTGPVRDCSVRTMACTRLLKCFVLKTQCNQKDWKYWALQINGPYFELLLAFPFTMHLKNTREAIH